MLVRLFFVAWLMLLDVKQVFGLLSSRPVCLVERWAVGRSSNFGAVRNKKNMIRL